MNRSDNQFRIGVGGYLWYLLSTLAVFLLSIPLALLLAVSGITKLLYPRRKESR